MEIQHSIFGTVNFCMVSVLYKEHAMYDKQYKKRYERECMNREKKGEKEKNSESSFVLLLF